MKCVPLHTTGSTADLYRAKADRCLRLAREARTQINANPGKNHAITHANVVPEYVRLARKMNHLSIQRRREMNGLNAKRLTPPSIPEAKRPGDAHA